MTPNPFECLREEGNGGNPETTGPKTPEKRIFTPLTPRKRLKTKRVAELPITLSPPKPAQPGKGRKSATTYLYLAKKALYAAIEAEKREVGEEYIIDNDIQLIYNDLDMVLDQRDMEIDQGSLEDLDLQC